ncbi:CyP450 monooxygenase [Trametes maxima]|nr:CyP450 monooxygenase [Trametes maxima]
MLAFEPRDYIIPLVISASILGVYCLRWLFCSHVRTSNLALPPGPRPLPIVGNVFDVPKLRPWLGFWDLGKKFGGIVYLQVLGQPMVILNNAELAIDLLDKRSANTSDRAPNIVLELSGLDFNLAFMAYGRRWRHHRRVLWQYFHSGAVANYRSIQRDRAHVFLWKLLQSPSQLENHIQNAFTETMLKTLYDVDVTGDDDEYTHIVDTAMESVRLSTPGGLAIETFHILRHVPAWFPGAGFQKILATCKEANEHLINALFNTVKDSWERGELQRCVAADMLDKSATVQGKNSMEDEDDANRSVCATAFQGELTTTFSALHAVFAALALFPDVQKLAQAELDAVVGPSRLPDFDDSEALVYVSALIKELFRWHVVAPLSLPHRTVKDDEFHGHFIPAGTIVFVNAWGILHDPEVWDNPEEFRPERFLRDGKLDASVRDPETLMFGFGRRHVAHGDAICPGRHFARASLFITVASVLHAFNIGLPLDSEGRPIRIKYEQSHGVLSYPVDARCTITPRSEEGKALILNACNSLGIDSTGTK